MMPRKTITIAEVGEIRTFGDNGKALPIRGEDGVKYECYRSQLFEHLTVGATVECEVEEKPSKDGRFINHNIQGVFKDGQPVGGQRQGGGRSYGKSPDERASIERQTAVKEVGLALRMGMPVMPECYAAYWRIVAGWLDAPPASLTMPLIPHPTGQQGASAPKPIQSGIPQPRTALDEAEDMDRAFAGTVATDTGQSFANRGAFLTAANQKWGLGPSEVGAIITTADMQDLSKAWEKLIRNRKEQGIG